MLDDQKSLQQLVLKRLLRLNATIYGLVAGLVAGMGLFIITNWLLLKGGPIGPEGEPIIGPNLFLLSQFFIGYRISLVGSLIGFAYAFVTAFIIGYLIATIYNAIVDFRQK